MSQEQFMDSPPLINPSANLSSAPPEVGGPSGPVSAARAQMLSAQWHQLRRDYAFHPRITVVPTQGEPPEAFRIEYRVRSVGFDAAGQLVFIDRCDVHLWLPPMFPQEPPVLRPLTPVFHPNVGAESISLLAPWSPQMTLAEVLAEVGRLLSYKAYDAFNVMNPSAMDWAQANVGILPLDGTADFSPAAGGEPLARIGRVAPVALEQVRTQLAQAMAALIKGDQSVAAADVRTLCEQLRREMAIFDEGDLPESVRATWKDLDDWAHQLPATLPMWNSVRQHRSAAAAALNLVQQLADSERMLSREVRAVETLPAPADSESADELLAGIPPAAALLRHRAGLDQAGAMAQKRISQAKAYLQAMNAPLPSAQIASGSLGRRLEAEIGHAKAAVEQVRDRTEAALARVQPLEQQAHRLGAAMERLGHWRDYADILNKGRQLAQRLSDWGAAGLHAFFIESDAGKHGPFDFEAMLEFGAAHLAVRNLNPTGIQVIDADANRLLASGDNGVVILFIKDGQTDPPSKMTFRFTGRCDELQMQLDYLRRELEQAMAALAAPLEEGESWMHRLCAQLGRPPMWDSLRTQYESAAQLWDAICHDVGVLHPYKQRLGLHNLIERMAQWVPKVRQRQRAAEQHAEQANAAVQKIAAASNHDPETGQLIVPQRHAQEYQQLLHTREVLARRAAAIEKALQDAASDVAIRLSTADSRGSAEPPELSALARLPQELLDLAPAMADEAILQRLAELEELLDASLCPTDWPAAPTPEPPQEDIEP